MKKILFFAIVAIISLMGMNAQGGGTFTVTHYNLNERPFSVSDAKKYISDSSKWDGLPKTRTYKKISFANLESNTKPDGSSCIPHFQTVSFPGNIGGKHDWFAVVVCGSIDIPSTGYWTFACGSDDGFEASISGHGVNHSLSFEKTRWYDTTIKTFYFSQSGIYDLQIVFFDYHINATLDFSMAKGQYTSFSSASFKLVEAVEGEYTIVFNANGGEGQMDAQSFVSKKPQHLSDNLFTRDGYVFMGWAKTADGTIVYKDGDVVELTENMVLYAVWDNPALTLKPESANWTSGAITLHGEDADTSGATHKYSLEYCNESGEWTAVDGAKNISGTKVQNSTGQEVWIAKLTDPTFSSRLGGIPPVSYRVTDETGRVSEPCVTRNRHGIFVGVGEYGPDYPNVKELENAPKQAETIQNLARGNAGGTDFHLLQNGGAKYADVNSAFNVVAENVKDKPGDICIVYFSTHGGVYKDTTVGSLVLYDKPPVAVDPQRRGYHEGLLANHIRSLDPQRKGVGVVCIVSACHSGAFFDDSNEEMCRPLDSWCHKEDLGNNVAWITAANASSSSVDLFDYFMIEYGWKHGWAKKNSTQSGQAISFYDLGHYAIAMYNPVAQKLGLSGGEKRKDDVLGNIVAGTIDNMPNLSLAAPSSPLNVQATKDKSDCVTVTWQQGSGGQPNGYFVLRNRKDSDEYAGFESAGRNETSKDLPDTASQEHPMKYAVAAYNGAGVAVSDGFAEGWRAIQLYQATFFYDLPGGYHLESGANTWVSPFMEDGQSLTPYLEEVTSIAGAWNLGGWSFVGWKNRAGTFVASKANGAWRYASVIVHSDLEYHAAWTAMTQNWLDSHLSTASAANGDIATAATMTAANGCRTVGECYALGINPEDPADDLRIAQFEMQDGKPHLTLNHTEDGSGKTFLPDVRVLGTTVLGESSQWDDVTDIANPDASGYRFFKATVELP